MPEVTQGLMLDTGKQFIAQLLTGKYTNNKFGMYIEFYNGAITEAPAIEHTRNVSYYTNLTDPSGFVRVPFVSTTALLGTSSKAMFTGSVLPGYTPSGASLDSGSKFYSATLVYMPGDTTSTDIPIFVRNFYTSSGTFAPVSYVTNTNFTATIELVLE